MSLVIRPVCTAEERRQLYRFRYSIYVEEMGRSPRHADHGNRTLEDPLDATAHNLVAIDGGRIVGALRANLGAETDFGEYAELYGMERAGCWFPRHVSMTSKFMIAREYRGTAVAMRLVLACFELGVLRDVYFDFMDTNRHLEEVYARLGYVPYRGRVRHPEYGDVLPMVLNLTDTPHLRAVGSPYVRVRRRHPWRGAAIPFPGGAETEPAHADGELSTEHLVCGAGLIQSGVGRAGGSDASHDPVPGSTAKRHVAQEMVPADVRMEP